MTALASPTDLLANVWLFSDLERAELELLARGATRRRWAADATVVRQGEDEQDLYAVADGLLQVSVQTPDGRDIVLSLLSRGDVFGEVTLFDGLVRSATVATLKPTELFVFSRDELLYTIRRSPDIALKLLRSMAGLVRKLTTRSEDLATLSVQVRLCKKLLEISEICGVVLGPNQVALPASLSQQVLANHVQATRESVNKSIARLIKADILHRTHTQLVIVDREALRAAAMETVAAARNERPD